MYPSGLSQQLARCIGVLTGFPRLHQQVTALKTGYHVVILCKKALVAEKRMLSRLALVSLLMADAVLCCSESYVSASVRSSTFWRTLGHTFDVTCEATSGERTYGCRFGNFVEKLGIV